MTEPSSSNLALAYQVLNPGVGKILTGKALEFAETSTLVNVLNDARTECALNYVKQLRTHRTHYCHQVLTDGQKRDLQVAFGQFNIDFTKATDSGAHNYLRAIRAIAFEEALNEFGYDPNVRPAAGYVATVKLIGENPMLLLNKSLLNCHACHPNIDVADDFRHRTFRTNIQKFQTENKTQLFIHNALASGDPKYRCESKSQFCHVKAENCMCNHSSYDMTTLELVTAVENSCAKRLLGFFMFDPMILAQEEGELSDLGVKWRKFTVGGRRKIGFEMYGDTQPHYVHNYATYMDILMSPVVRSLTGRLYHVRITSYRVSHLFFEICPFVSEYVDRSCIWWSLPIPDFEDKVVVYTYDLETIQTYKKKNGLTHEGNLLTFKKIVVDASLYERSLAYALGLEDTKFLVQSVKKAVLAFNNTVVVNGAAVTKVKNRLESKDIMPFVIFVYMTAYVMNYNSGKVLAALKKDIADHRDGTLRSMWRRLLKPTKRKLRPDELSDVNAQLSLKEAERPDTGDESVADLLRWFGELYAKLVTSRLENHQKLPFFASRMPHSFTIKSYVDAWRETNAKTVMESESPQSVNDFKDLLGMMAKDDKDETEDWPECPHLFKHEVAGDGACVYRSMGVQVGVSVSEVRNRLRHSTFANDDDRTRLSVEPKESGDLPVKGWGTCAMLTGLFSDEFAVNVCVHQVNGDQLTYERSGYDSARKTYHFVVEGAHCSPLMSHVPDKCKIVRLPAVSSGVSVECDATVYSVRDAKQQEIFGDKKPKYNRGQLASAKSRYHKFAGVQSSFVSRAGMKLTELMYRCLPDRGYRTHFDICFAPGGFIQAFKLVYGGKSYGVTLVGKVPYKTETLYRDTEVIYTEDGGDILKGTTRASIVSALRKSNQAGVDFVTADGAPDTQDNEPVNIERFVQLLHCELALAVNTLKFGGDFVVKVFDIAHPAVAPYVFLMTKFFESVDVVKPLTSRPASSEVYLVCKGLKNTAFDDLGFLPMIESSKLPEDFLNELYIVARDFLNDQMVALVTLGACLVDKDVNYVDEAACRAVENTMRPLAVGALSQKKFLIAGRVPAGEYGMNSAGLVREAAHVWSGDRVRDKNELIRALANRMCTATTVGRNVVAEYVRTGKICLNTHYRGVELSKLLLTPVEKLQLLDEIILYGLRTCIGLSTLGAGSYQLAYLYEIFSAILEKGYLEAVEHAVEEFLGDHGLSSRVVAEIRMWTDVFRLTSDPKDDLPEHRMRYLACRVAARGLVQWQPDDLTTLEKITLYWRPPLRDNTPPTGLPPLVPGPSPSVSVETALNALAVDAVPTEGPPGVWVPPTRRTGQPTVEYTRSDDVPTRHQEVPEGEIEFLNAGDPVVFSPDIVDIVKRYIGVPAPTPDASMDAPSAPDLDNTSTSGSSLYEDATDEQIPPVLYPSIVVESDTPTLVLPEPVIPPPPAYSDLDEAYNDYDNISEAEVSAVVADAVQHSDPVPPAKKKKRRRQARYVASWLKTKIQTLLNPTPRVCDRHTVLTTQVQPPIDPRYRVSKTITRKIIPFEKQEAALGTEQEDVCDQPCVDQVPTPQDVSGAVAEFLDLCREEERLELVRHGDILRDYLSRPNVVQAMHDDKADFVFFRDGRRQNHPREEVSHETVVVLVHGKPAFVSANLVKNHKVALASTFTHLMTPRKILALCDELRGSVKMPDDVGIVQAAAGAGKSTMILQRVKGETSGAKKITSAVKKSAAGGEIRSMIVCSTKQAKEDMRRRLALEMGRKLTASELQKVRTVNSILINGKRLNESIDNLWIDEALMSHPGALALVVHLVGATKVRLVGDVCQIQFVNRVATVKVKHEFRSLCTNIVEVLEVSWRCPVDVAARLNSLYRLEGSKMGRVVGMKSANIAERYRNTCSVMRINNIQGVPVTRNVHYLCFTQSEKQQLLKHLCSLKSGATVPVNTVHEFQGSQAKYVYVVRLSNVAADDLYKSRSHAIVALTRHTDKLVYYTMLQHGSDALEDFIKNKPTDVQMKEAEYQKPIGYTDCPILDVMAEVSSKSVCALPYIRAPISHANVSVLVFDTHRQRDRTAVAVGRHFGLTNLRNKRLYVRKPRLAVATSATAESFRESLSGIHEDVAVDYDNLLSTGLDLAVSSRILRNVFTSRNKHVYLYVSGVFHHVNNNVSENLIMNGLGDLPNPVAEEFRLDVKGNLAFVSNEIPIALCVDSTVAMGAGCALDVAMRHGRPKIKTLELGACTWYYGKDNRKIYLLCTSRSRGSPGIPKYLVRSVEALAATMTSAGETRVAINPLGVGRDRVSTTVFSDCLDILKTKGVYVVSEGGDVDRSVVAPLPVEERPEPVCVSTLQGMVTNFFQSFGWEDASLNTYLVHHENLAVTLENCVFSTMMDGLKQEKFDTMTPVLNTPMPRVRPTSLRESFLSAAKRNFSVPKQAGVVSEWEVATEMFVKFLQYFDPTKLENICREPVRVNAEDMQEWLDGQDACVVDMILGEHPLNDTACNQYNFGIKRCPKCKLEDPAHLEYVALQTIVFHEKYINSIFCVVMREIKKRVIYALLPQFKLYTDTTPTDFAADLTRDFPPELAAIFQKLEIDISKYDKSQGYLVLIFELLLLRFFRLDERLINIWVNAHLYTKVSDRFNGFSFKVPFQRKSGDASTFIFNTLFLMGMIAYMWGPHKLACGVFSGDDSVLFGGDLKSGCEASRIAQIFNLETKFFEFKYSYFCSKFLVDLNGEWAFVADPLKLLVKLGRSDLRNEYHLEEYRVSYNDHAVHYHDPDLRRVLSHALAERYHVGFDSSDALYHLYLAGKPENFKKLFYVAEGANLLYDKSYVKFD